jgi:hypothetical protein
MLLELRLTGLMLDFWIEGNGRVWPWKKFVLTIRILECALSSFLDDDLHTHN